MSSPPAPVAPPALCVAHESAFWPRFTWPDFARWPDKSATVVVVPLCGFCDWGLGHPFDAEEVLSLAVLRAAVAGNGETPPRALVLPPLRFLVGQDAGCAFSAPVPEVHRFIAEVVESVAAAGFTRIVLYNASPWNEDVIDVAARDLRIEHGLQMFCVNLSGLGFDLHPTRSGTRREAQTVLTWLLDDEPEAVAAGVAGGGRPAWPEAEVIQPLPGPARSLSDARSEGPELLAVAVRRLRGLLAEIAARAPVPPLRASSLAGPS